MRPSSNDVIVRSEDFQIAKTNCTSHNPHLRRRVVLLCKYSHVSAYCLTILSVDGGGVVGEEFIPSRFSAEQRYKATEPEELNGGSGKVSAWTRKREVRGREVSE